MELLCNDVSIFLDDIDHHLLSLIRNTYKPFITNASNFNDINIIILYGNNKRYLEAFFYSYLKNLYSIKNIKIHQNTFQYVNSSNVSSDIEYYYSDYHFEFDYSDKYIKFIKSIIVNSSITGRQIVFFIKNMDKNNSDQQIGLTRLLEQYSNVKFIFTVNTLNNINNSILSRSICFNLSFSIEKIHIFLNSFLKTDYDFNTFLDYYHKSDSNIIIYLWNYNNNFNDTRLVQSIKSVLINITKERNHLNIVMKIRELCYRLYHMSIPISYIAKKVIEFYSQKKILQDVIELSAHCDHLSNIGTKDILVYEKYFLNIYKIIKNL